MFFARCVLILLSVLLINRKENKCPSNWIVLNRDCCSLTYGFNSTALIIQLAQGVEYSMNLIVWNDPKYLSLGIDIDWTTLNIH